IKRVEILAAMRERAPGLPEVDPAELGKLRTLQEIVDRMDVALPVAPSPALNLAPTDHAAAPVTTAAPATAAPSVDLKALMLEIVADKTGYPADMLELSMDLEADLGVDSIKRVEILAAMRERAPGLPEVDPAELGKLRTLQEIVDRMDVATPTTPQVATAAPSALPGAPDARRYALKLVDAPATGFALAGLLDLRDPAHPLVLVEDGRGVAPRLAEHLRVIGLAVEVALAVPASAGGVIFLEGLSEVPTIDDALAVQRRAFLAAKAVAPRFAEDGGVFVTVQDTGGDFGLGGAGERAWLGGLPGLVKTAAQEWPKAALRAIDLERAGRDADALAAQLAQELLHGGPGVALGRPGETLSGGGLEVTLDAAGRRRTLVSFAADVVTHDGAPRVDASSVILASGGARGVTAATLIRLAQATRCKLVLLGRTALADEPPACAGAQTDAELKRVLLAAAQAEGRKVSPADLGREVGRILSAREVRQTLAAIEAAGGQARYVAADVADRDTLRAALAPIRREWGPITGVVHGAGLLADRFIADKTPEQFDLVFDTKVRGLLSLLEATREDAPSVLVAFSSVAGRCGNRGQCDYAMANETLSKVVAAEARARGLFGRSLGWGPWEGGMVTPALRAHFERLGVPLLPLDVGAQMLVDELAGAAPSSAGAGEVSVELVLGGEPRPEPLAGDAGPRRDFRYDLVLDRRGFPAIDHHRVKGEPVVPVALVLELFARAVHASRPDLVFARCEEVKVFRGIPLQRFDAEGDRFAITLDQRSNGDGVIFVAALLDHEGKRRYGAVVHALRAHPTPLPLLPVPDGLVPFTGVVYDGVALFHGDAFQVIDGAPAMSEQGLTATLVGGGAKGWTGPYALDPALLDGGLQLALLWTTGGTGAAALPTAIGALHVLRAGLIEGDVRVVLQGRERRSDKGISDLVFLDEAGDVIAELRGVEMHVLPATAPSAHA
ncbi:MAG: SDR family oxidoreductase, partial [Myxococcales bacterium]|nr:SDR family oxidoreductase [Myxococcales bacterium]